jgi:hypothetical protein
VLSFQLLSWVGEHLCAVEIIFDPVYALPERDVLIVLMQGAGPNVSMLIA